MNFKSSNMSYMSGSVTPSTSKLLLKMRKLLGGKAQICYAGGPCFLNNFHSRKTYAARQADFAQTNGFKAFSGIRQKNPLIQSQYPANFWFFLQTERISRPNAVKVIPPRLLLALWRTVTARVPVLRPDSERCTMERVSRLVGPMCNRGISLQIRRYCQGRKVCRLKSGGFAPSRRGDIVRQSRASNRKHSKKLGNITLTFLAYYLIFFPL